MAAAAPRRKKAPGSGGLTVKQGEIRGLDAPRVFLQATINGAIPIEQIGDLLRAIHACNIKPDPNYPQNRMIDQSRFVGLCLDIGRVPYKPHMWVNALGAEFGIVSAAVARCDAWDVSLSDRAHFRSAVAKIIRDNGDRFVGDAITTAKLGYNILLFFKTSGNVYVDVDEEREDVD